MIVALNKHYGGDEAPAWRHLPDDARPRHRTGDPAGRVRQINADVRDGYRHTLVARSRSASPVNGLGFDTVADLLRATRVLTQDDLMPDLDGGRGLKFSTYVGSREEPVALTGHLVTLRLRTDYRGEWDWIDHVVPVTPRLEVERLLRVPERLALLDWHNITLPGQTPFGPCDLITDDARLVFGKLKGPSSTFSHLCTPAEPAS